MAPSERLARKTELETPVHGLPVHTAYMDAPPGPGPTASPGLSTLKPQLTAAVLPMVCEIGFHRATPMVASRPCPPTQRSWP
jgi:hypothetical protein